MSVKKRVSALEKVWSPGLCMVKYKAMYSDLREEQLPLDKAFEAAKAGRVAAITFPLSFNESMAEVRSGQAIMDEIIEEMRGVMRDTGSPSVSSRLLLCTKPIVYAKQAPPKDCFGHLVGGCFITEDGQEFHQSEWEKILKERDAGFIVVTDYDESREPWHKQRGQHE